jgi:excisionase family DNA binding protein
LHDLLTTKQLQGLLQVDRVTIYRMLEDGRLRGFKVGGQWRFSRQEIETWLQQQRVDFGATEALSPTEGLLAPSAQALPLSCLAAIQELCADALDVAILITDLQGSPLSEISNCCPFCSLILSTYEGRQRCMAAWRQAGQGLIHTCHAGLLCVSAPVRVHGEPIAITSSCQFALQVASDPAQRWQARLSHLASDLRLAERDLEAERDSVRLVPESFLPRVTHLVQRMAGTFSEIGQERLDLLGRLQHIAEISRMHEQIDNPWRE